MARTRATKAAAPAESKASEPKTTTSKFSLSPRAENASKVFVLPTKASPEARIVTLPHPRHGRPARYLVCPETGIYEFTKVATPKTAPRSWLIETTPESTSTDSTSKVGVSMGQDLYLATLIDPLFLVIPALTETQSKSSEGKRLFLSSDDHFDKLPQESSHLSEILRCDKTRKLIESRMAAVCDTVEAGDESMFRMNESKLAKGILEKAQRMQEGGLAPTMEEKFVKKALEAPILVQTRETRETTITKTESPAPASDSNDSQSTAATGETEVSQASTVATSLTETTTENIVSAIEASADVVSLQRLRVAFSFICSGYISQALATQLEELLKKEELVDFAPLDDYLATLAKLRAEAMAAHSIDYSRKRGLDEEEDEALVKKRKMEEEKKKKSQESRGVRNLKKVNTTGMKKMSDFFKKK
ncbi:ribonuclease H2, subunit B [Fusarium flagelliforme]|uniref:Ribonuclease H2 subunit B n=1 Tax=Fusarium flagelliforme TaxID=2675880 RepID=A0A395N7A1_9HYPO|nr:ribonuclease H2, subunit B [Fusarium flagelliforme]KAH7198037.1 ribonuclease H2, subunit B [Fusarium flagelliforme]RFN55673.1 ribonuclease h2 subunit b [Fusarium flagelliforme]